MSKRGIMRLFSSNSPITNLSRLRVILMRRCNKHHRLSALENGKAVVILRHGYDVSVWQKPLCPTARCLQYSPCSGYPLSRFLVFSFLFVHDCTSSMGQFNVVARASAANCKSIVPGSLHGRGRRERRDGRHARVVYLMAKTRPAYCC